MRIDVMYLRIDFKQISILIGSNLTKVIKLKKL